MKVYATLVSDKARKSQGGQKYIQIILAVARGKGSADDSVIIAKGVLERKEDGYSLYFSTIQGLDDCQSIDQFISDEELKGETYEERKVEQGELESKIRGEKQKGDATRCEHGMPYNGKICSICHPEMRE